MLDREVLVAETSRPGARDLAAVALPLVQTVLDGAGYAIDDVDLIAVSVGPGSFTGLRIGLSIAKGFALATGCDVVGVPTLEALAHVAAGRIGLICPVLDARKGEVYAALFRSTAEGLTRVAEDCATTPESLATAIDEPCVFIGDGVEAYRTTWRGLLPGSAELLPFTEFHPSGMTVARLGRCRHREHGADAVAAMVPRYCRVAEAELRRVTADESPSHARGKGKIDSASGLG